MALAFDESKIAGFVDGPALRQFWTKLKSYFVKKVDGKDLSTNDYTTDEKTKLSGIEQGATNVTSDTVSGWGYKTTDTTYTLTQDDSDGHKITLTPSIGSATTITIPDNNTTYSSKTAVQDGEDVSLVTTGEKYYWNNKSQASGTITGVGITAGDGISVTGGAISAGSGSWTISNSGVRSVTQNTTDKHFLTFDVGGTSTIITTPDTTYSNFIKSGSTAAAGLVPAPPTTEGITKYLCENGTWAVPSAVSGVPVPTIVSADAATSTIAATTSTTVATLCLSTGKIWLITGFLRTQPAASATDDINVYIIDGNGDTLDVASSYNSGTRIRGASVTAICDLTNADYDATNVFLQVYCRSKSTVTAGQIKAVSIYSTT